MPFDKLRRRHMAPLRFSPTIADTLIANLSEEEGWAKYITNINKLICTHWQRRRAMSATTQLKCS